MADSTTSVVTPNLDKVVNAARDSFWSKRSHSFTNPETGKVTVTSFGALDASSELIEALAASPSDLLQLVGVLIELNPSAIKCDPGFIHSDTFVATLVNLISAVVRESIILDPAVVVEETERYEEFDEY